MAPAAESGFPAQLLQEATSILNAAWDELQRAPYVQARVAPQAMVSLDVSLGEAERRSAVGREILARLMKLETSDLPHSLALALRMVRFRAHHWARQADWYWLGFDARGTGQFGLFLPTAYSGGYLLNFAQSRLVTSSDRKDEAYAALIDDYSRLLQQFVDRTAGQAERGIRMPKPQVLQARALLAAFRANAWAAARGDTAAVTLDAVFERALQGLSDEYLSLAPDRVGIRQYPGGEEVYCELVRLHTTLDLTPEQVHARGLERMAQIEESISGIQAELGFGGDAPGFLAHLNEDARWRASTVEGVTSFFQRYIDRLERRFDDFFASRPQAAYGVAPLPAALEQSMTYGHYDAPKSDRPRGLYRFNAANLTRNPLFHVGALTYHELMPGHHLQFALQAESATLHPFCAYSFVTAYVEGWAEYAATLAGEMGLYETPQERYGRLVMDAFLTTRLVVDTGMNVLGWSLERGRDYMRKHSRLPESEILTETVRYACDIPGQALAYKLGDTMILTVREQMRRELGNSFSVRDFHSAVLAPGALPLQDLAWHVEHETAMRKRSVAG